MECMNVIMNVITYFGIISDDVYNDVYNVLLL